MKFANILVIIQLILISYAHWWCFTLNNPEEAEELSLTKLVSSGECTYVKFQLEKGEEGTEHFQGVMRFTFKHRLAGCKKTLSRAHWEVVKNVAAAVNYAGKDDTRVPGDNSGPFEFGVNDIKQGKRNDLEDVHTAIKDGTTYDELCDNFFGTVAKYPKFLLEQVQRHAPRRDMKTAVILLWGDAGTGKTGSAHATMKALGEKLYLVPYSNNGLWFPGYNGQDAVDFDDFKGQVVGGQFLQLLDMYDTQVEVKGGHVRFNPKVIFITSNTDYDTWYDNSKVSHDAIRRRIDLSLNFKITFESSGKWVLRTEVARNTGILSHFVFKTETVIVNDVANMTLHITQLSRILSTFIKTFQIFGEGTSEEPEENTLIDKDTQDFLEEHRYCN